VRLDGDAGVPPGLLIADSVRAVSLEVRR